MFTEGFRIGFSFFVFFPLALLGSLCCFFVGWQGSEGLREALWFQEVWTAFAIAACIFLQQAWLGLALVSAGFT